MIWSSLLVTAALATCTTAALLVIALPLAYFLSTTKRRRTRFLLESLFTMPLVLPPTVLGFYLLLALGPHGPIPTLLHPLAHSSPAGIAFTFPGILIGSILFNLPFALTPFTAALDNINPTYIDAAKVLGAKPWLTFRKITLPLAAPGILAGLILTFAHTTGEFGVVLMLGGNIPGQTRTLSIEIYDQVVSLDYRAAGYLSAGLLVFSFLTIAVTHALRPRPHHD